MSPDRSPFAGYFAGRSSGRGKEERRMTTWAERISWTTAGIAAIAFGCGAVFGRSLRPAPPSFQESAPIASSSSARSPDPIVVAAPAQAPIDSAMPADLAPNQAHANLDDVTPAPPPRNDSALAAGSERSLIEGARTALSRGRPSDALRVIEQHDNLYPNGDLSEEGDFLRVNALRDLGRIDEAQSRAREFVATYPSSALRSRLRPLLVSVKAPPTAPPPVASSVMPSAHETESPPVATTSEPSPPPVDDMAHGAY